MSYGLWSRIMVIAGPTGSMRTGGMLRPCGGADPMRSGRDLQGDQENGELRIEGEGWEGGRALGGIVANTCSFRMWVPWEMLLAVGATVQHTVVTVFRTF